MASTFSGRIKDCRATRYGRNTADNDGAVDMQSNPVLRSAYFSKEEPTVDVRAMNETSEREDNIADDTVANLGATNDTLTKRNDDPATGLETSRTEMLRVTLKLLEEQCTS